MSHLSDLASAQAAYSANLKRYLKNPSLSRDLELSRKQLTIDRLRTYLKLRTFWYEKEELKKNDEDLLSEEPRLPLEIPVEDEDEEKDEVEVGEYGATTMTLDDIEKVTALSEKLGLNAPVWNDEMGALVIEEEGIIYRIIKNK